MFIMKSCLALAFLCPLSFLHLLAAENGNPNPPDNTLETYIVLLEPNPHKLDVELDTLYDSFMPTPSAPSQTAEPRMIHRYRNVFTGFAAKLSEKDVQAMRQKKGFISAQRERIFSLLTTHTPNFLGLKNSGFWKASNFGKGVIIGVLDSGVAADHPSFSGAGIPPPPKKWKGRCGFKSRKACNNKLIGARVFQSGLEPIDTEGHGTHTASTAAGSFVKDANIFGEANGTAAGVAPLAHLAVYKVCNDGRCNESDILAALDAAIVDGVDIVSMSLGGPAIPYYQDSIAIGAYAAMEKGIFVSCAAGNSGPSTTTVQNDAPWILTVGASTHDRKLEVDVVLGDEQVLVGQSAFQPKGSEASVKTLELTFPDDSDRFCEFLGTAGYKGKAVVCEWGGSTPRIEKGEAVKNAGGSAMILVSDELFGNTTLAEAHVLPVAHISSEDGRKLKAYANSTSKATASLLFKGTQIGDQNAPFVAGFSSRGPSGLSPGILKPDVIGPGVNVLAAWPKALDNTTKTHPFNMISGTSMSTPHLSGVAALIKSVHPDWSPAAIKSAIVTTARTRNLGKKPITNQYGEPADAYTMGAGHVNPSSATDPGLIYDLKPEEYIRFLCGLNYTNEQVGSIVRRKVDCTIEGKISQAQLNYPSFSISFGASPQTYSRTVTNVGEANSSYEVKIESPEGITIKVEPTRLVFTQVNQQLSYNVTFTGTGDSKTIYAQGSIYWNSAKHVVRTPVGFIFENGFH